MNRGLKYRWINPRGVGIPEGWEGPELVGRLLRERGVENNADASRFLNPDLSHLHDEGLLSNIQETAQEIVRELKSTSGRPIWILADYDADGITAAAILFRAIQKIQNDLRMGTLFEHINEVHCAPFAPDRMTDGYGISLAQLEKIEPKSLAVSVDCGVTAFKAAARAKERGIRLFITDHHKPQLNLQGNIELPSDTPVVHPLVEGSNGRYPFPEICGATVAYKLALKCLKVHYGVEDEQDLPNNVNKLLLDLLSLAALGTIADVVPLEDENRVIAGQGLRSITACSFPGVKALLRVAKLGSKRELTAMEVGFRLGPRLNAVGRLGNAEAAVELLCTDDQDKANDLALELDAVNDKRQDITRTMSKQAEDMALAQGYDQPSRRCIVLCGDDWHPGVVGIVASRMVERFGRPAILLAREGDMLRGSARSIDGFSIYDCIDSAKEYVEKFGGHDMAAGLSLASDQYEAFTEAILKYAMSIDPADLTPALQISSDAELDEINLDLVQGLQPLEPFGRSNPEPILRVQSIIDKAEPIGQTGSHVALRLRSKVQVKDGSPREMFLRAIWFNAAKWLPRLAEGRRVQVLGVPRENRFRGSVTTELEVKDMAFIAESDPC